MQEDQGLAIHDELEGGQRGRPVDPRRGLLEAAGRELLFVLLGLEELLVLDPGAVLVEHPRIGLLGEAQAHEVVAEVGHGGGRTEAEVALQGDIEERLLPHAQQLPDVLLSVAQDQFQALRKAKRSLSLERIG